MKYFQAEIHAFLNNLPTSIWTSYLLWRYDSLLISPFIYLEVIFLSTKKHDQIEMNHS